MRSTRAAPRPRRAAISASRASPRAGRAGGRGELGVDADDGAVRCAQAARPSRAREAIRERGVAAPRGGAVPAGAREDREGDPRGGVRAVIGAGRRRAAARMRASALLLGGRGEEARRERAHGATASPSIDAWRGPAAAARAAPRTRSPPARSAGQRRARRAPRRSAQRRVWLPNTAMDASAAAEAGALRRRASIERSGGNTQRLVVAYVARACRSRGSRIAPPRWAGSHWPAMRQRSSWAPTRGTRSARIALAVSAQARGAPPRCGRHALEGVPNGSLTPPSALARLPRRAARPAFDQEAAPRWSPRRPGARRHVARAHRRTLRGGGDAPSRRARAALARRRRWQGHREAHGRGEEGVGGKKFFVLGPSKPPALLHDPHPTRLEPVVLQIHRPPELSPLGPLSPLPA